MILVLSVFSVGCDGGGSGMEQEPDLETMTLTIYNPSDGGAQTNVDIDRGASSLEGGDKLNVFVRGRDNRNGNDKEAIGVSYPSSGSSTNVEFTVPAGDYDVDLLGYKELTRANVSDKNSAIVYATTGENGNVTVNTGENTKVNFVNNNSGNTADGLFSEFELTFNAGITVDPEDPRLSVILEDGNGNRKNELANDVLANLNSGTGGGIGISPKSDGIQPYNFRNGVDKAPFAIRNNAKVSTRKNKINLDPDDYDNEKAVVILELKITDDLTGDNQNIFLYNDPDGDPATVDVDGYGTITIIV